MTTVPGDQLTHYEFFLCVGIEVCEWPAPTIGILTSQNLNGHQVTVFGCPDGALVLRVEKAGLRVECESDMIVAPLGFKAVMSVSLSVGRIELTMNSKRVPIGPTIARSKSVFPLYSPPDEAEVRPRISQMVPSYATEEEALLIRHLHDLDTASRSHDWFTLLKSSLSLRLLLLDGFVHRANARHRLAISFMVPPQDQPPVAVNLQWRHLALPATARTVSAGLDEFLRFKVLESDAGFFTVKDVIRAAAHASGVAHYGPARGVAEELVLTLDKTSVSMGHKASHQLLQEICAVTVLALTPLLRRIQGL